MSWIELTEVLGNVGEFLASIGVLVTLIYLAVQVKLIRTQTENDHKSRGHELIGARARKLVDDRELLRLHRRGEEIVDPEYLSSDDKFSQTLINGGLTPEETAVLHYSFEAQFQELMMMWKTGPNDERKATYIAECAMHIVYSPLFSVWFEVEDDYPSHNQERRIFVEQVRDKVAESKQGS
jgi:hypothetical protein